MEANNFVNSDPPKPPKLHRWRCINGHEYKAPEPFAIAFRIQLDGQSATTTKVIRPCPFCYLDWIASHVPECRDVGEVEEE